MLCTSRPAMQSKPVFTHKHVHTSVDQGMNSASAKKKSYIYFFFLSFLHSYVRKKKTPK